MLTDYGWGEDAIEAALDPTPDQEKERGMLATAAVNPEQHSAIQVLHLKGWGVHDICLAVPAQEPEIVRVLRVGWKVENER